MSLREFETVLAELATDGPARSLFFADRQAVLRERDLSASERDSLLRLSETQIGRFARSLHAKRRLEAAPLLPWAVAALGSRFVPLFRAHCEAYRPTGLLKPGDDARAFCLALARNPPPDLDARTRELLRWEAARRVPPARRSLPLLFRFCPVVLPSPSGPVYAVAPGFTLLWPVRGVWRPRSFRLPPFFHRAKTNPPPLPELGERAEG